MDDGPWTGLGTFGWFLGVWVVMMAAMMLPSVSPTVALYSRMTRARSPLAPLLFTGGYLIVWAGAGALTFAIAVAGAGLTGDVLAWDRAGRWVAGATLVVGGALRADAAQGRLPGQVPEPARLPARVVARRPRRRAADGRRARRLVRRLLLGADGVAVRARRHEHRLDGVRRRADRDREDGAVAPRRDRRARRRCCSGSACSCSRLPGPCPRSRSRAAIRCRT